jgi:hypothetical protein
MTNQEAFDKVWDHFVTRGGPPSVDLTGPEPGCVYRGPNGERCGAGVLLPDEAYDPGMEGVAIGAILGSVQLHQKLHQKRELTIKAADKIRAAFTEFDRAFVAEIQRAHDEAAVEGGDHCRTPKLLPDFPGHVRENLLRVAKVFRLTVPA